jgi:hypothetical protein
MRAANDGSEISPIAHVSQTTGHFLELNLDALKQFPGTAAIIVP